MRQIDIKADEQLVESRQQEKKLVAAQWQAQPPNTRENLCQIIHGGLAFIGFCLDAGIFHQLGNHVFQFGLVAQNLVSAMPLRIIGSAHPGAEFGGAPPVMPQIKMHKVNRLVEWRICEQTGFAGGGDGVVAELDAAVDFFDQGISIAVKFFDKARMMAFGANRLHADLIVLPGWTALALGREQIPGEAVAHIVGGAGLTKAADVANGAGRRGEILNCECAGFGIPIPVIAASLIGDAMERLDINLVLGMVGANVAVIAGFWLARLFEAEFVPQVTILTLPDRAIGCWCANVVAALAGESGNGGPSIWKSALRMRSGLNVPSGMDSYMATCSALKSCEPHMAM